MSIGKMLELAVVVNGTVSASFSSAFTKAGKTMRTLCDTMKFVNNEQRRLDAAFNAGRVNTATYAGAVGNLQSELKRTKYKEPNLSAAMTARPNAGQQVGDSQSSLFSTVSAIGTLAELFFKMVRTAADFDASMSKVKAVTGATGEEFQALKATAQELGTNAQFSASQAAEAMSRLGTAGWQTEQIIAGMPELLHLAVAADEDLATAANIVSDDLTAFKMSADQAEHMADVMAAASSGAKTNVRLLGEAFKYCAPVAGAVGYSLEDISIAVGLMAEAGIRGSEAGTALQKMMTQLVTPTGEAADAMEKLGIMQDNAAAAMKRLDSAIETISISIGSIFLPLVANSADKLAGWVGSLSQLAAMYPGVTQGIFGMASAISGLISVCETINTVSDSWEKVKDSKAWKSVEAAMKAANIKAKAWGAATRVMTGLQWAWNAAMAANPAGLVVLGIAALIGIGYLLYDNWDTLTSFMGSAWDSACSLVSSAWEGLVSFLNSGWNSFKSGVSAAWDTFCNFCYNLPLMIAYGIGYVLGYLSTMPERIGAFINEAGAWLSQLPSKCVTMGMAFITATGIWLANTYNTIATWFSATITETGIWLEQLPQNCAEAGAAFITAAEGWAKGAYDVIVEWITQIPSLVWAQISEAGDSISQWWGEVKAKFSEGFAAGAGQGNTAVGTADTGKIVEAQYTARGGIFSKGAFLTTFAEESPEAAIPLDGSPRAIGLWQQAGEMLGMKPADTFAISGGNSVTATFAPQIHIAGNADAATTQQIQQALQDTLADFERKLAALQSQKERVSYG